MINQYDFTELSLSGVFQITPFSSTDNRGRLVKDYSQKLFKEKGIEFEPVETLCIYSNCNVLRGLHFQRGKGQAKLLRCVSGLIWAVAVDLRCESPTCGKWIGEELTPEKELFIPEWFALGTYALRDSILECKCGEKFYAEYDDGIRWDDGELNISWPIKINFGEPIISDRDKGLPSFQHYIKTMILSNN